VLMTKRDVRFPGERLRIWHGVRLPAGAMSNKSGMIVRIIAACGWFVHG
jgi:hypothetical protein